MVDRDSKGHFIKGKSGNPGGRPKEVMGAEIRAAVTTLLTTDRVNQVVNKMIDQAVAGDRHAREHLFAFLGIDIKTLAVNSTADDKLTVTVKYVQRAD